MRDDAAVQDLARADHLLQRVQQALLRLVPDGLREAPAARALTEPDEAAREPPVAEAALLHLADGLALGAAETLAALLAWRTETDAAFGVALGLLQGDGAHPGARRPTVGLMAAVARHLEPELGRGATLAALLHGTAQGCGLLRLGSADALAHERTLSLAPPVLGALLAGGVPARADFGAFAAVAVAPAGWPLPPGWEALAQRLAADPLCAAGSIVVLRGGEPGDLRPFAAAVARRKAWLPVEIVAADGSGLAIAALHDAGRSGLRPWLSLTAAAPLLVISPAPGEAVTLPAFGELAAPIFVLAPAQAAVHGGELPVLELDLPPLDADDRVALWRALVPQPPAEALDRVRESRCGAATLARAAAAAAAGASPAAAMAHTLRSGARDLSAWAQIGSASVPAEAFVGPPALHGQLELLHEHCIARERLGAALGPLLSGRLEGGVKALFVGASGTGKTLAAQWLADRLGLPLARIDLASVVSKYIGETEKNLSQMLARAEHLDAVLLFDEADSLFGARTDVRQANDRYANMQTNYLLQRLESFRGIALLTSNSKSRFDEAFMRRLDAVIEFPLPDAAERLRLWQLHLGDAHALQPQQLARLAALVDLPGGHIRNAVLDAALRARLEAAERGIGYDLLAQAVVQQYAKLGRRPPDGLTGGSGP